jgi:two-component system NarL family sensor kinase
VTSPRTFGPHGDPGEADRQVALIRLAAMPVIFVGERLVAHPTLETDPFDYFLVAAIIYSLAAFLIAYSKWRSVIPRVDYAVLDLAFICALDYSSGGAFSQLRYAFFLLPVLAAFLLSPIQTAGVSGVSLAAYLAISLTHPATGRGRDLEFVLTQAVYLCWMALAAILLARVLTRRADRIVQLASDRRRLVAEALDAEDRERRRLAEALHDRAIQNLLVARQELEDGAPDPTGLARAREGVEGTLRQLRDAAFELHPYALEQAGLAAALQRVADWEGRRGSYTARVAVSADATGAHDQLIFSVARELLVNAARHARAGFVSAVVERSGEEIVLEVSDDGGGFPAERRSAALLEGHIGLASITARVEAIGGSVEISSPVGRGTTVRAVLPAASTAADRRNMGSASPTT